MKPKIYVGIPTRNRPEFVRIAIQSVLDQTHSNFRVMVTDNESDPEIADDVRRFVSELKDDRVNFVSNPVPDGERGQTLYNLQQCEEPYFVLLHDDDRFEPDLLERAAEALESHPDAAFVSTAQYLIDADGARLVEQTEQYEHFVGRTGLDTGMIDNVLEVALRGGAFSMSGTVFRREPLQRVGMVDPDGGGFPIDLIVFMRLGENGERGYFIDQALMAYRWHSGQSRAKHRNWTFNEWMIDKFVAQLEPRRYSGFAERKRRQLLAYGLCRRGIVRFVAGDASTARSLFTRALAISPRTWQAWAYYLIGHVFPFLIRPVWGGRVSLKSEPE